jgi:mannose-6-phosphate isomerase-like protein (cupin superfamily)
MKLALFVPAPSVIMAIENMPQTIGSPTAIATVGNLPKMSDEYVGLVNTGNAKVSITLMHSPPGWVGIGRTAQFHEFKVVVKGTVRVTHPDGDLDIEAGQAVHVEPGEWVRYSTPTPEGADYVTVCTPAFSRAAVQRDAA